MVKLTFRNLPCTSQSTSLTVLGLVPFGLALLAEDAWSSMICNPAEHLCELMITRRIQSISYMRRMCKCEVCACMSPSHEPLNSFSPASLMSSCMRSLPGNLILSACSGGSTRCQWVCTFNGYADSAMCEVLCESASAPKRITDSCLLLFVV